MDRGGEERKHKGGLMKILVAVLAALLSSGAAAQAWPTKPVRIIVPFAPGGPTDIVARLAGQKLGDILGQPMVIESRAGAGGNIGTAAVAKSAPDGYTVLLTSSAFAVNVTLSPNAGYTERDFIPIANLAQQANLLFVHPDLPAKTLAELLALVKGGRFAFASPGVGTTPHLTAENLFNVTRKLDVTPIHFKGAGPSAAAVVSGEPKIGAGAVSTPLAFVKAGKLRAIAVSSANRIPTLPDVPTFAEAGIPGVEDYTWIAMFVPAGTPPAVVQRLSDAVNQVLREPEMRERLVALAFEPVGGTPQAFAAYVRAEIAKWGKVVKDGNIKAE
jgi:tripartite-type tricarboxylate transporter receptor subunit TctC